MQKLLKSAPVSVPVLTCFVYMLLTLCGRFVTAETVGEDSVFLVIIIVQIIVFAVPCFLYYGLKGGGRRDNFLSLSGRINADVVFFTLASFLALILGSLAMQLFLLPSGGYTKGYMDALFDSAAGDGTGLFLAYCVFPAVCEELFFRGLVLSEYRPYGSLNAVAISALYFTMVHFSKEGFVLYLLAGLLLGAVTAVCRTVYPAMALHMAYNIFFLYGDSGFVGKITNNTSMEFFGFVIVSLLLLSFFLMFSRLEHIYYAYAEKKQADSGRASFAAEILPAGKSADNLYIYITPALIAPIAAFILINALV